MRVLKSFLCLLMTSAVLVAAPSIVPRPQKMVEESGVFELKSNLHIRWSGDCESEAMLFAESLLPATGFKVRVLEDDGMNDGVLLKVDSSLTSLGKEGYQLKVSPEKIVLTAPAATGIFYGCETLKQLLPVDIYGNKKSSASWSIPCVSIEDQPTYPWRGIMLDVSRYFMDTEYVKRYLDMMAMHKLNVFHWHLIDDAGWRIEIEKYPKLTEIGAWRGKGKDRRNGGFYTKKQLKEIVKYAAERHIEIVPEIELPAHTLAALAAYPYLGCRQIAHKVPERHFISRDLYCAGRDTTYEFLADVMKEVFEIFPGKYIHVGGDEAKYDRWRACKHCQEKIKKEGLKNEKELQGYMTRFFEKLCQKENRQIIGWDEILKCNVSKSAGLMVWHNTHHAVEGAKLGHPVVAAYVRNTYFDTPESRLPGELVGATWTPPVSLEKSYAWDPCPKGLTKEQAKNILGGHGCLWTDQFLHKPFLRDKPGKDANGKNDQASEDYVDKLTLPRMAGLAESCWTKADKKDFVDFTKRIQTHLLRYEMKDWKYRLPLPKVTYTKSAEGVKVEALTSVAGGRIFYTTNGEKPTTSSKLYTKPVYVEKEEDFQAIAVSPGNVQSLVAVKVTATSRYRKFGKKVGEWKSGKVAAKKAAPKTWEVTGLINKNGNYRVTFIYTGGTMRLDTDWIEILKNDQVIKRINRHGFTTRNRPNHYDFKINDYETGASFKIRAGIYGDQGNDSNGLVFIKKK